MSEIIKPYKLQNRDAAALISPVSLPPQQYRADLQIAQYIENQDLETYKYIANSDTPKNKITNFNQSVYDGMRVLLPISGNRYGEDLWHRIDYAALQKNRPIFCTFSAASAFMLAIHIRTNLVVFYGPHISFMYPDAYGRENSYTRNSFWNMLYQRNEKNTKEDSTVDYSYSYSRNPNQLVNLYSRRLDLDSINSEPIPFIPMINHQAENYVQGRIFPCFLKSVVNLLKREIKPDFSNRIILCECDETSLDESLVYFKTIASQTNMSEASAIYLTSFVTFKQNPPNYTLMNELYNIDKITEFRNKIAALVGDNLPVLYGFPMGHLKYKLTVPAGIYSTLNLESGDIEFNESVFENSEHKV